MYGKIAQNGNIGALRAKCFEFCSRASVRRVYTVTLFETTKS